MAENLLEQLDQRIQRKENVTAADVADVYTQTVENRRKEYLTKGGKYENFETEEKAFLDAAKALRNKCLEGVGALGTEFEKQRYAILNESREKEHRARFETAWGSTVKLTDPEESGAAISDYEGTGDDDRYGFGRMSMQGYLMGMQTMNPNAMKRDYDKAVDAYKKSNYAGEGGWAWMEEAFTMDEHLSDENVKKIIGHENLARFDAYDLAFGSKAFLASYAHYSDEFFKDANVSKAYKDYIDKSLQELKAGGKLNFQYPKDKLFMGQEPTKAQIEIEKSQTQIYACASICNPQEWQQMWRDKLQKTFDPFKKSCDTLLTANPDFKFQDPAVNLMLSKSLDDLSYLDDAKLNEAVEKARKEFAAYMQTKKDVFGKDVEANKKAAEGLKARNKALRAAAVTEDEWKSLDSAIGQQSTDLDAASPNPNSSLADLTLLWNKLAMVRDGNGLLKTKLDDLEKKTKDAEEKEPFVLKFLDEKNLSEKYDDKSKQWSYTLGEIGYEVQRGKLVSSFKNPDISKLFESKVTPFINSLLDKKPMTADEKKHVDEIMAKADKNNKEQVRAALKEATEYMLAQTQAKLTSDDLIKFQQIDRIIGQAKKDCSFSFDHRPTLEELKKTYDTTFVPAWDRAGKDFETQVKPAPITPGPGKGPGGGGGFLGGGGSPEKTPSSIDPYGDNWATGNKVPMPEGFKGYAGGLQVSNAIVDIKFRDETTHRVAIAVPGGTGSGSNEITFADPNADAWRVNDRTFVKVKYRGKVYYAAMEFLQKNAAGQGGQPGGETPQQKTPGGTKTPEVKPEGELAFLGKVNSEYRDALERMLRDHEKPGGALFDVNFNKKVLPCRLSKTAQGYVINWQGGSLAYPGLREAMTGVNSGILVMQITYGALLSKDYYKPYEKSVDSFKEDVRATGRPGEVYFELDWSGAGRGTGNAQVWATAYPYGGINYHIHRDHVALDGGNDRDGFAANFDDFMKQVGHVKKWSENYEDDRDDKKLTQNVMTHEWLLAQINDPRNFYSMETAIGRPVWFGMLGNGVVQMYLDWGGGASTDFMKNPMLNVWIENGKIRYILNYKGKTGYTENGSVRTLDELTQKVAQAKSMAAGGVTESAARSAVDTPPPAAKAASKPKSTPSATPITAETSEDKERGNRLADGVKKKSSDAHP